MRGQLFADCIRRVGQVTRKVVNHGGKPSNLILVVSRSLLASTLIARYRRVTRVISRQPGLTDIPKFYSLSCSPYGLGDTAGYKAIRPHATRALWHSRKR